MKIGTLIGALLIFAGSATAQTRTHGGMTSSAGNGVSWSLGGQIGGATINSGQRSEHHLASHPLTLSYGRNDGEYVATTYMNYDEALALGRQQLADAEQTAHRNDTPSLGEIARNFRAAKTMNLQASRVQGESHNLEVCDLKTTNCRRL